MVKSPVRTLYPWNIEKQYAKDINTLISDWNKGATVFLKVYLKRYINGGTALKVDSAQDDPMWSDRVQRQLQLLAFSVEQASPNAEQHMTQITTKFVRSLNAFSYANVKKQTAIVGLDPISDNTVFRNWVKTHIGYNTSLIKTMQTNYINSLKNDIYRSITSGGGSQSIAQTIVKRTHVAKEHAKLIAIDQTGKIISQFDAYRAKSAGAERYIWRSMEDNRVRPKHRQLDGKDFKYGDPAGGDNGLMPGEPIRCRCVADPIF